MPCGRPRPSCGSIPWSYCGKDRRDVHHECKGAVQPESIHLAALVCGTRWRLPILLACAHALRTPILSFASSTRMSRMRSAQCCVAVGGDSPEALRALELFRKVASPAAVQVIEDFLWLDAQLRRTLRTRLVRSTSSFSPSSTAPQNVVRQARPNRPICD